MKLFLYIFIGVISASNAQLTGDKDSFFSSLTNPGASAEYVSTEIDGCTVESFDYENRDIRMGDRATMSKFNLIVTNDNQICPDGEIENIADSKFTAENYLTECGKLCMEKDGCYSFSARTDANNRCILKKCVPYGGIRFDPSNSNNGWRSGWIIDKENCKGKANLSTGSIVGIVLGSLSFVGLSGFLIYLYVKNRN